MNNRRNKSAKQTFVYSVLMVVAISLLSLPANLFQVNASSDTEPESEATYHTNPTDLSLYPTDIEGISIEEIANDSMNGFHLRSDERLYEGVVITYGGSEGSPNFDQATYLAQSGYEVLALFMYGMPNQPPTLLEIPIDDFQTVLDYIDTEVESSDVITLYGGSKGAEYALNVATYFDEVDNIVLMAPSAYNFSGLDFEQFGSSWTFEGEALPYVDVNQSDYQLYLENILNPMQNNEAIRYEPSYTSAVEMDDDAESKRIKVEETQANILIFAGGDDQMWNSAEMGQIIEDNRPENTQLEIYEEAGHIFFGDGQSALGGIIMDMGGNQEANEAAFEESQTILYEKLAEWHEGQ